MELFYGLSQKSLPISDTAAIFRFDVYQNDVRADSANAMPGDNIVLPAANQAEITAWSRHNNGAKPTLRQLQPRIGHKAQPPTVGYTDYLFAKQV